MSNPIDLDHLFAQLLLLLRTLPADSPEWDDAAPLSRFLAESEQLRQGKLAERETLLQLREQETVQRALLRDHLRRLQASPPATLAFFDLADVRQWPLDHVPADRLEAVVETVRDLGDIVHSYALLEERAQRSLAERRQVTPQMTQLERNFEIADDFLRQIFPRPAELATPTKATPPHREPPSAPPAAPPLPEMPVATVPATPSTETPLAAAEITSPAELAPTTPEFTAAPAESSPPDSPAGLPTDEPSPAKLLPADPVAPPPPDNPAAASADELPPTEPLPAVAEGAAPAESPPPPDSPDAASADELPPTEPLPAVAEGAAPAAPEAEPAPANWSPATQLDYLWRCVGQDDLPAAYWVARALATQDDARSSPPSELLAAVQGSWWLSQVRGAVYQDMLTLSYEFRPGTNRTERLLATAAALLSTLIAPDSGFKDWLAHDPGLPQEFDAIVKAIYEFSHLGEPFRPELISPTLNAAERQRQLGGYQEKAKEWLAKAPHLRPGFQRATDVWHRWTDKKGQLGRMMAAVAAGNAPQTAALITEWRQYSTSRWIDRTDYECSGRAPSSSRRIDGKVRDYLLNAAEEAVALAESWLALAQAEGPQTRELQRRVGMLMKAVRANSGVLAELARLEEAAPAEVVATDSTTSPISAPLLRVVRRSLQLVLAFLGLGEGAGDRPLSAFPAGVASTTLYNGLRYRLLLIPEIGLPDNPEADPQELSRVALLLNNAADRTPAQAFNIFLERSDYRFAQLLLDNMTPKEADIARNKLDAALAHSRSYVVTRYEALSLQTEQAVVDGLLDEGQRAELNQRLEGIRASSSYDFGRLDKDLGQVESELDDARAQRVHLQSERWQRITARLEAIGFTRAEPDAYRAIADFISELQARRDIVVIDERLARLEELLDEGATPTLTEFTAQPHVDIYQTFIETLRHWEGEKSQELFRIVELQQRVSRNDPRIVETLQIASLPKPRREEFNKALEAWRELKQKGQSDRRVVLTQMAVLLRDYLGFTLARPALNEVVSWRSSGQDWAHLTFAMSLGDLSPLPQFGSLHGDSYDVVVLWERPSAETIGARLDSLKLRANSVLVIFLGALGTRHRLDQLLYNRQKPQAVAILDHYLLLYLARHTGARLPIFFNCALPLARLNPYAETGPVAVEMFKGREAAVADLMNPLGRSLVYGGRQLGKSALFQAVQRQFHDPSDERYVLLEDIKTVGDQVSQQPDPDQIWERLRTGLVKLGLLKTQTAKLDANAIARQIEAMVNETDKRRVLVLLDEADNFLTADQKRNFELVSRLKALMDATQRRFKIIFAGLHNVQRYINVANQPLAHLNALQVQPLDPASARRLIVEPLATLGFRFDDETPILSILAYSNSHPGLIQLLCHRLLERLYQQRPTTLGPYPITREDVEAVYRQREVQDGIRWRFEWTLALDPRYKALAEMMVFEQSEDHDSYARAFNAAELRRIALFYWRAAFENSDLTEFRSYLDEMVGLGVLVRTQDDTYRLRSPNLVRLMGSREDIAASLDDLRNRTPVPAFEPDSHRAALDDQMRRYSPFTFAQERSLLAADAGVCLIFGSQALGIDSAADTLKRQFAPAVRGRVREIRLLSSSGEALAHWLKQEYEIAHRAGEGLLVYRHMSNIPNRSDMLAQVRAATDFLHRHRRHARHGWLRVLFLFDTTATLEWLRLAPDERRTLEETEVSALVVLRRWDRIGLAQRLHQHDKMAVERVIRTIEEAFDGWPWLLDKLADTWIDDKSDDPLRRLDELRDQLHSGQWRDDFLRAAGCDVNPATRAVLQTIVDYKAVPESDAVPAFLDERLSPAECDAIIEYLKRLRLIDLVRDALRLDPDLVGDELRPNPVIARLLAQP